MKYLGIKKPVLEKIQTYSERMGKPYEYLLEEYNKLLEYEEKNFPERETNQQKALKELRRFLAEIDKKIVYSSALTFNGFVFGDSWVLDTPELLKNKALGKWNRGGKERDDALKAGEINREGIPLDTRKQVFQKGQGLIDNPRYGYPFLEDEHSYFRYLYGIAGKGEEMKTPRFFQLIANGEAALNLEYPLWTQCLFRATLKRQQKDKEWFLNHTSVTEFKEVEQSVFLEDLIYNCGKKIWKLEDIGEVYDLMGKDPENPQLFEADVWRREPEPDRFDRRRFYLGGEDWYDFGVLFTFPTNIKVFNSTKIVALGYVDIRQIEDKTLYQLRGYGYYPLPGYESK